MFRETATSPPYFHGYAPPPRRREAAASLALAEDTGHWVWGSPPWTEHMGPEATQPPREWIHVFVWSLGLRQVGHESPIFSPPQVGEKQLSVQNTQNPWTSKVKGTGSQVWWSLSSGPLSSVKSAWFTSGFSRGGSGGHFREQQLLSHSGHLLPPSAPPSL